MNSNVDWWRKFIRISEVVCGLDEVKYRRISMKYWHFLFIYLVPPDILDYPTSTDMIVPEGRNVTLKCAATGSPTPNITWRKESGERIMLNQTHQGENLTWKLQIFQIGKLENRNRQKLRIIVADSESTAALGLLNWIDFFFNF